MTTPRYLSVNIPFEGFYNSRYSEAVDHEETQWCEYEADEREEGETQYPAPLRLDASELADLLFRHTDYSVAYDRIAKWYVKAFADLTSEALGFPFRARFEAMVSPREYNFGTDRLFVDLPISDCRRLFAMSKADGHATLRAIVRREFTSRDGFSSFYSPDLADWLEKPLANWDHNELGTLLRACLDLHEGADPYSEDFGWRIYERVMGDEGAYEAWERAVNWAAFETACDETRADKAADLADGDPDKSAFDWRAGFVFRHPDQTPLI